MRKLDKDRPFSEVLGKLYNGVKYYQDGFEFSASGELIGKVDDEPVVVEQEHEEVPDVLDNDGYISPEKFARELMVTGHTDKEVREMTKLHHSTVRKIRREFENTAS